jgi:hypothetical protein
MWAYPNMIPLPPPKVHGIWIALKPYEFDTTYGGFAGQNVSRPELKAQVLESMKVRYCNLIMVVIGQITKYNTDFSEISGA